MIGSVFNQIETGAYATEIQNLLGNTGASATLHIDAQSRTAVISGTPTGVPAPTHSPLASIVSFSPQAEAALSGSEVALRLITAGKSSGHGTLPAAPPSTSAQPPPSTTQQPTNLSSTISGILDQAKTALADPSGVFYQLIGAVNGPEQFASFFSDPQQRQSFIAAFNDHSLTIQSATDVAGLNYSDSTVLTGTSESGPISVNEAWMKSQDATNGTYSTGLELPSIGGLYVTWKKPAA